MNKILLIEDDKALNENLVSILSRNNFNPMIAENGKTGLELAKYNNPDAVVCDIMLPDVDGYRIITSLKESGANMDIPFLFISAKSYPSDIKRGMDLGADDYLVKPFKASLLINSLNALFDKRSSIKGNILLLDMDAHFASTLATLLENNGYKCCVSSAGCSEIDFSVINKTDLILYNVDDNKDEDYSSLIKLREKDHEKEIPIIFLGNELKKNTIMNGGDFESCEFFSIPFDFEKMLRVIGLTIKNLIISKETQIRPIEIIDEADKYKHAEYTGFSKSPYKETLRTNSLDKEIMDRYHFTMSSQGQSPITSTLRTNSFLLNRDISKDFEQYLYNGIMIVLVNLNRADCKDSLKFQKYLLEIMGNNHLKFLIDMSQTEFLDSAFVGAIVNVARKLKLNIDGEMRIVINFKNNSTHPFLLEGLRRGFITYDNLNFAINCFNPTKIVGQFDRGDFSAIHV